jgi:O-antigen/teichoic acid export membrane protein
MTRFSFSNLTNRVLTYRFPAQVRTASNLLTNVYSLIVGIVFVPLYINYIGIEAYGIIGAFNGITTFLWLFDFGVTTNINREMAKFYETEDKRDLIDLKKTLEIVCYCLSGLISLFLSGFIALLAFYWFNSERFTPSYLFSILAILAFSLVLQFPIAFYTGGLQGLNQQIPLNFINIFINTVKCVGSIAAVVYFDDKIHAFLISQLLIAVLQLVILRIALAKFTETGGYKGKFRREVLSRLKKFTSELFANNVVIILLMQSDKVILSRILSLEDFGYYMLAYNITTMTVGIFSNSVTNVIFPNFSRLVMKDNREELIKNFHLGSQLMAWGMVSIATVLAFFSQEILVIWARNPAVAEKTSVLLAVWAIGMGINTLSLIPYYLQLAFGRSNISFRFNLIALILNIPALIIASHFYGALGAAVCWLTLNSVYLFTFIPIIKRNFLSFSLKDWYFKDVLPIIFVGALVGAGFRWLVPANLGHIYLFVAIGACFACIAGLTFFMTELPKFTLQYDLFYKLKRKFL